MSLESKDYVTQSAKLVSRGLIARYVVDNPPPGSYFDLLNCESREENSVSSRFGRTMITTDGNNNFPLAGLPVNSLGRMKSLEGASYRYAGCATSLFRRSGSAPGAYGPITASVMSGEQMSMVDYRPNNSSIPYMFFADQNIMLKDNGVLAQAEAWGLLPPVWPVFDAYASAPATVIIDLFEANTGFTFSPSDSPTINTRINTIISTQTTVTGTPLVIVTPVSMNNIQPGCMVTVDAGGNQEICQVLSTTATTFTVLFTKTHVNGTAIFSDCLQYTAGASGISTITKNAPSLGTLGGNPVSTSDTINLYVNIDNPANLTELRLLFDVGNGTFTDYYWKSIVATDIQTAVVGTTTSATTLQQRLYDRASGQVDVRGPTAQGLGQYGDILPQDDPTLTYLRPEMLTPGLSTWSRIQIRIGEFVAVGRAGNPGYTWSNVNKYQLSINANAGGNVVAQFDDLYLFGGSGPDSFGGQPYTYVFTFYNANTGGESNPSQFMNPANAVFAYRQPITIAMLNYVISIPGFAGDLQNTHLRVYRQGGTLTQNYYMVAQVPIVSPGTVQLYTDPVPDSTAVLGQILSLTNDPPVTSQLPVPVNTTLGTAVLVPGEYTVTPASTANISLNQVLTIDANTPNQETVVVIQVNATEFSAFFQFTHLSTATVQASAQVGQPCNLAAVAFNRLWLAGDPNNPHFLYYSNLFGPEGWPAANFLEIGTPGDPIMAIVPFWSQLFVFTLGTVYQILGADTTVPIPLNTATSHGLRSQFGWAVGEGEIMFISNDGIYAFTGSESRYMSKDIEWLFNNQNLGPVPPLNLADISTVTAAYYNNKYFFSYTDINGARRRVVWDTTWKRWRDDSQPAYAMLFETDLADLVFGDSQGLIYQDLMGNFDSAGFVGGVQQYAPMNCNFQTTSFDQDLPKNNKVYNEFTIDIDTGGIPVTLTLLFNNQLQSLALGTVTSNGRAQFNFNINQGDGYTALNVGLQATWTIGSNVVVNLFQIHIRYFVEAETRLSFDSYWTDFGLEGWKFCKQTWLEYSAIAPVTVNVYIEGSLLAPAYSFTLPSTGGLRNAKRVRFPAVMAQLWRWIGTSTASFQFYEDRSYVELKNSTTQKGYAKAKMAA